MGKEEAVIEKNEVVTVDASKLDAVVDTLPPVNPDLEKEPDTEVDFEKVTDKHGRKFDPQFHEVAEDGKPKINKKDGFITCKPGRTPKVSSRFSGGKPQAAEVVRQKETKPDYEAINRRVSAEATVDIFIQLGIMIFGPEWQAQKTDQIDERANLVLVTDRYFEVKGISDIPPGAAMAVAFVGYAAARMQYPSTQTKVSIIFREMKKSVMNFFSGIGKFFKRMKGFRNVLQPDNRSNGVGENDSRKNSGEKISEQKDSGFGA